MYTLEEVFNQALDDKFAGNVDGVGYEARINNGTKISKDSTTGKIELFNISKGGGYYLKLIGLEVESFLEGGWRYGTYVLSLSNNRSRLDSIERSIRREVNGSNNPATLRGLKKRRAQALERYSFFNQLIKQSENGTD